MSAVQAALLSEMIHNLRAEITGEITYLISLRQQLSGGDREFSLCWPSPTLLDDLDTSRAELFSEQAQDQRIKNALELWRNGAADKFYFARTVRPDLAKLPDEEIAKRLPELPDEAPEAMPQASPFGGGGGAAPNGSQPQMNLNQAEVLGLKNGGGH